MLLLLKPSSGDIYINNEIIDNNNINSWRNITTYLPQDVFIINNTIQSNVALGELTGDINKDTFKLSLEKAKLFDFVNSLKDKDLTVVGEKRYKTFWSLKNKE